MKKLFYFFLIVSFNLALADNYASNKVYKYLQTSENNLFYFISTPYSFSGEIGITKIYNSNDSLLYQLNFYLATPSILSNNGEYIVSYKSGVLINNITENPVVQFYRFGDTLRGYNLADLEVDISKLPRTVSYIHWSDNSKIQSDTLSILAVDKKTYNFSLISGKFLGEFTMKNVINKAPQLNVFIYKDIKYPAENYLPKTIAKQDFITKICQDLDFEISTQEEVIESESGYYIEVFFSVEANNKATFQHIRTSTANLPYTSPQIELKIKKWLTKTKFDTSKNPFTIWSYSGSFWIKKSV